MKIKLFPKATAAFSGFFLIAASTSTAQLPFKPLDEAPANAEEEQQLNSLFSQAREASASVAPGPNAGFQRRQIANELNNELENFVAGHTNSAWTPSVRVWLARNAQLRSGYSQAMDHYGRVWATVKGLTNAVAVQLAHEAGGALAKLLALTGRVAEYDALEAECIQFDKGPAGSEWGWAREIRAWARKHPTDAYKCGLHCLDQLGRLTQPSQFRPKDIVETESSLNGFTAADLVQIGTRAGLRVRAALLNDFANLPVPCVVHLRSEHFVVIRERRGDFYDVYDTAAFGPRWLLPDEIARESSGCVIVSDAAPPTPGVQLTPLDAASAAAYRGRCHGPLPYDHDDSPCPDGGGGPQGGDNIVAGDSPGSDPSGSGAPCGSCSGNVIVGMANWFVSEPWLNLWLLDTPLHYKSPYGPDVSLRLAYNDRSQPSVVSGEYWHGVQFGNHGGYFGLWSCSWLSFAELSADEYTVDLALPAGRWATFTFAANSTVSQVNYRHNSWLEKVGSAGNLTSLILHRPDGSGLKYGVRDDRYDPSYRLYYMTEAFDASGQKTTFAYNTNFADCFALTNVAAADGTGFTLDWDDSYANNLPFVTNITSSYGASVSFVYQPPDGGYYVLALTNIVDAAGISSQVKYESDFFATALTQVTTPYGTTYFSTSGDNLDQGIFDRTVRITNSIGQQEFYGQINTYAGADWPGFVSGQIPTNTPIGTLDTSERQERNSFYWNVPQFQPYVATSLYDFTWQAFNRARIRHWLANTDPTYTHFDTLSVQQEPSPDGSTNIQGQLAWFDYVGKDTNVVYEIGKQIMPSVIARVMPDGSTWYQYFERLTNGLPTKMVEKWANGSVASFRTNTYSYAANNVDMTLHIGPNSEQVSSNVFNAYHQVTTNYDALNQVTTYTYDSTTHQLASTTRPTGLTTTNIYDGNHRLQKVIDLQINRTNSYTWYASGNVESHTSERGLSVTNYWDALNRLTGTKHPDGTTTSNLYTVGSTKILDLTATKDRLGYWAYFGYDAIRRKIAETNANGAITRWGYCDCGATAHVTNAWNTTVEFVMQYDYDNQGNRIYIRYPDATVTNWYDSLQRLDETCDAWGCRWFYYDNLSRLTNISNAIGTEKNTTYDIEDRAIYVTDANGVTMTNTYDVLGRLSTRSQPDGVMERFGYSARGLIAYTNQLDKITYYGYDEARRKIAETNANNEIIRYTNNAAGDLLSLTDGKNQRTKWNYDEYGRVTNKLDQVGTEILLYKYDPDSRLTNRWSAAKTNTYYAYDPVGNLTNIDYPVSTDVKFQYDALNRLTNMVDASGTNKYAYATGGQLWTEDGPFSSDTVTNTYNNRLRTALSLAQPTGAWTNGFGYDAAKRLTNVTSQAGSFTYQYPNNQPSTLIQKLALPNGSYITNTYDTVARLTGTWLKNSTNGTLNSHEYTYNPGNQRTQQVFNVGSTYSYTYDAIGQLTFSDSATASEDRRYVYDAAWNLNYRTNNATLYTFEVNTKNELTNAVGLGGTQTYDANGNLKSCPGTGIGYSYDDENRLVNWYYYSGGGDGGGEPTTSDDLRTEFVYDGLGRLRKRIDYNVGVFNNWSSISETRYVYDGMRVIQERDGFNNTPQVSYTRGNDLSGSLEGACGIGGLLVRSHGYASTNGSWYTHNCYHADGNGNITYLVSSSQGFAAKYRYDPFGNTISLSGSLASANVYRFSSKEIHVNSGLYYYGYRWYAPNLQRWLNRDPMAGWAKVELRTRRGVRVNFTPWDRFEGPNLYAYVRNTSVNAIDPNGDLWPLIIVIPVTVLVIIALVSLPPGDSLPPDPAFRVPPPRPPGICDPSIPPPLWWHGPGEWTPGEDPLDPDPTPWPWGIGPIPPQEGGGWGEGPIIEAP